MHRDESHEITVKRQVRMQMRYQSACPKVSMIMHVGIDFVELWLRRKLVLDKYKEYQNGSLGGFEYLDGLSGFGFLFL